MVNRLPIRIVETQEGPALEYAEEANLGNLFSVLDQLGFELHIQLVRKDGTSKAAAMARPPTIKVLPGPTASRKARKKAPAKPGPPILADSQLGKVLACFTGTETKTVDELVTGTGIPKRLIHGALFQGRKRGVLRREDFGIYAKV